MDRQEKVPWDRLGLLGLLEKHLLGQDLQVRGLLDLQGHLVGHQVKVLLDHQVQLDHRDWVVLREDLQGRQGHLDWYVLMVGHPLVHLVWDLLVRAIQQVQVP